MSANLAPPLPVRGTNVLSYLQKLNKWLKSNRIIAGAGLRQTQTQSGVVISSTRLKPFEITNAGGLEIRMEPGRVACYGTANDTYTLYTIPASGTIESPVNTLTLSDNTTTKIWLEFFVTSNTNTDGITVWMAADSDSGAPTDSLPGRIQTGPSVPTQTFARSVFDDPPVGGTDYETVYVEIAEVTTSGEEVTEIVQSDEQKGVIPMFFDASIPTYMIAANAGDIPYTTGTSIADWTRLSLGTAGAVLTAGTAGPEWSSDYSVTISVVSDVEIDSGNLRIKTRDIEVFSAGTESAWIPV